MQKISWRRGDLNPGLLRDPVRGAVIGITASLLTYERSALTSLSYGAVASM